MRIKALINGKEVVGYWNGNFYKSNKGKGYVRIYIDNEEYHVKKDEFIYGNEKTNGLEKKLLIAKELQKDLLKKYEDDKEVLDFLKKQDIIFFTKEMALQLFRLRNRELAKIALYPEKLLSVCTMLKEEEVDTYNNAIKSSPRSPDEILNILKKRPVMNENLKNFIQHYILKYDRLPETIEVIEVPLPNTLSDKQTIYRVSYVYYNENAKELAKANVYFIDNDLKRKDNDKMEKKEDSENNNTIEPNQPM